jgi:DNA-binding transcriptional ArsR family regulator
MMATGNWCGILSSPFVVSMIINMIEQQSKAHIEVCQYINLDEFLPLDTLMIVYMINCMDTNQVLFAIALADETRQEIMKHLCCAWLNVNDLVDKLGGKVKQPTVSHHLKKLEEAGLVYLREEGRFRYYTLNQEQFTLCCGLLVKNFAPNYAAQVIPLNEIPTNKT